MNQENNKQGFEFDPKEPNQKNDAATGNPDSTNQQSTGYQGHTKTTEPKAGVSKMQQALPNSGGILAMGILSIVLFCCCYGGVSLVLGIIALVMSSKANRVYFEDPDMYTEASYKNMKAGRVTAIIGLVLAGIMVIVGIVAIASGLNILSTQEALHEFEQVWESTGY
jgi:hypothetical protein